MNMSLRLLVRHTVFGLKEHFRQPGYFVSTLLFPAIFFLFFAWPEASDENRARVLLASFSAFAVIGVVFFQFAVGTANERHSTWNQFLRSLPVGRGELLIARSTVGLVFASLACLVVWGVVMATTGVRLTGLRAIEFWFFLVTGAIPFALLGVLVGQVTSPKSSVPFGNLIYLSLSYLGGLWYPPEALPTAIQKVSPYVPTRAYAEVLWDVALSRPIQWTMVAQLAGFSVLLIFILVLLPRFSQGFSFGPLRLRGVR